MSAKVIQVQYEQLQEIARRFEAQAETSQEMHQNIRQHVDSLSNQGWVGEGASAFFGEMEDDIFPALRRLTEAFEESIVVTSRISEIFRTAEEEAVHQFRTGDGAPGGAAGLGPGAEAGRSFPGDRLSRNLVVKIPEHVFSETYMENFIGSHNQGENSAELNLLLEELLHANRAENGGQAQVGHILDQVAVIRDVNPETFREQYEVFQNLWRNAESKGDIDLSRHDDYMGSTVSLRYGAVVGDVFGIDPVFGAILNPTGGLVGPGSTSYQPHPNDALGYHGIFHDAGGYLYNIQGHIGPGYDYLNREPFPTGFPGTGQIGGISWWASHLELNINMAMPDIPYVPGFVEHGLGITAENVLNDIRPFTYAVEGGMDIADGVGDIFQGQFSEGFGDILDGSTTVAGGMIRTGSEAIIGKDAVDAVFDLSTSIFG